MANWCNLRLVVTGRRGDVEEFRRAAGARRGRIATRKSAVFTPEMEIGEGGDLEADGVSRFRKAFQQAVYRFQGRNDDYQDHFVAVSKRFPALAFVLVWSDPNVDANGSYFLRRGRGTAWEVPDRTQEVLNLKYYRQFKVVDANGEVDYDAPAADFAEWRAFFEMMDVAQQHWDDEVEAWLKANRVVARKRPEDLTITLGISARVQPATRTTSRSRVKGDDNANGIAETVVLTRWRKRPRRAGEVYRGFRLAPATWWVANLVLQEYSPTQEYRRAWIASRLKALDPTIRKKGWTHPGAGDLAVLLEFLRARYVLDNILGRHGLGNIRRPGVPGLFLFKETRTGRIDGRFVAVRLKEPVSAQQKDEIRFLRLLGLQAGVLRMVEAKR